MDMMEQLSPSTDPPEGSELSVPTPRPLEPPAQHQRRFARHDIESIPAETGSANLPAMRLLQARDTPDLLTGGPYVCSRGATTGTYLVVWSPSRNYTYSDDIFAPCGALGLNVASVTTANVAELTAVARSCGAKTAAWVTTIFYDQRILGTSGTGTSGSLNFNYWGAGPWPVLCALPVANQCSSSSRSPAVISFDGLNLTSSALTGVKQLPAMGAALQSLGISVNALTSNGTRVGDSVVVDTTTVPALWRQAGTGRQGLANAVISPNAFLALFGSYVKSTKGAFDLNWMFVTGMYNANDHLTLSDIAINGDGSLRSTNRTIDFAVPANVTTLLRVGWAGVQAALFPEYVGVDHIIGCF
ncbi:hypothetical protein HDU88_003439 [Geranomyces variabilis]|nr:hypothetical protein HDU88_003439 [Geranomyces variabilis]